MGRVLFDFLPGREVRITLDGSSYWCQWVGGVNGYRRGGWYHEGHGEPALAGRLDRLTAEVLAQVGHVPK